MILVIAISVQIYGINMTTINITEKIASVIKSHAENDYPNECCGFILGQFQNNDSIGIEYFPADNVKEDNRRRRFLIDPKAYQKAEDEADERGLSIISIVHSHPDHPDIPSDFDRDHAWPGFSYIIVSVNKGKATSYCSWQLNKNREFFIKENLKIIGEKK